MHGLGTYRTRSFQRVSSAVGSTRASAGSASLNPTRHFASDACCSVMFRAQSTALTTVWSCRWLSRVAPGGEMQSRSSAHACQAENT